jgi:site-specific recombinase XerC
MAAHPAVGREPWNKGKLVGQKAPFKLKEIWAIRIRLQLAQRKRELALFNLAIDSKLRACDLVKLRVRDVCHADRVSARAIVMQQKNQRPVQFEITDQTRMALAEWIKLSELRSDDFVFPGHAQRSAHLSQPANTHGSLEHGSRKSDSILRRTRLIR